jgi:hypothetical protein
MYSFFLQTIYTLQESRRKADGFASRAHEKDAAFDNDFFYSQATIVP